LRFEMNNCNSLINGNIRLLSKDFISNFGLVLKSINKMLIKNLNIFKAM
jgi:hypothetical protein